MHIVNRDDWNSSFGTHDYLVHVTAQGIRFAVNADHEGDAIDAIIDHCEDHAPGLLMDDDDIEELTADGFLDDYICGGNHGRYISTLNVSVIELRDIRR